MKTNATNDEQPGPLSSPTVEATATADGVSSDPAATDSRSADPVVYRDLIRGYDGPGDLDGQLRYAEALAKARRTIPPIYRGSPGDILVVIGHARALNIPVQTAVQHLFFSDQERTFGQVGLKAVLMNGLLLRAGWRVVQLGPSNDRRCDIRLRRPDGSVTPQVTWHILDAQRAGLIRPRSAWEVHPTDMLWARALSRASRRFAANITMGLSLPEELTDEHPPDETGPDYATFDIDGNAEVAPDVAEFLGDLDTKTLDQIRHMLQVEAPRRGLLQAYAGTVSGIHHTVQEVLYDAMSAAAEREFAAGTLVGAGDAPAGERQHLVDMHQADAADAADAIAAGQGRLPCGCGAEYVLRIGNHVRSCSEHRSGGNAR